MRQCIYDSVPYISETTPKFKNVAILSSNAGPNRLRLGPKLASNRPKMGQIGPKWQKLPTNRPRFFSSKIGPN